jgi:aminopeptidase N
MVIEFLYQEIPAFGRAIPRALGNLRHSGDSFGRLFSAMGFSENSSYGEMYLQWLYSPGLPIIQVVWADTPDVLHLKVSQYQPGQDFPLGSALKSIVVRTSNGSYNVDLVQGSSRGFYSADLSGIPDAIRSVMIDPSQLLPADIVYKHSTDSMDGI